MEIIIYVAIVVGVILISMTLHEAMHAFTSYWLGDDTAKLQGRLTLNPVKHIDPFLTILLPLVLAVLGGPIFGGARPVPFNPDRVKWDDWGAALIAIAGPLTNLVLAFLGFGVWVLVGAPGSEVLFGQIMITFFSVNLGFFLFNMLPIPPLDGSRVIYALAPEFVRTGMRFIEQFGIFFILALVLLAGPLIYGYIQGGSEFFVSVFTSIFRL
jgi:Zn-dependent protease